MTASTLTRLPLMAGSALLGTLSRAGHWTFTRYMKAPLASTGLLAMVTLTALAGSNALYFQTVTHPSPFFAPARDTIANVSAPATERTDVSALPDISAQPAADPVAAPAAQTSMETTGSVPDAPVGNAKMFEVQKKLFELQLFTGKVDGYYGPRTADAIRAFEQRNGMKLTGSTDAAVLDAILSSDASGRATIAPAPQAQVAPAPAPAPAPAVQQAAMASPPATIAQPEAQQDQIVARLPALTPAEQVLDNVAQTAASTIDSIIANVDVPRSAPQAVANPPIPSAPVAVGQQPLPAQLPPSTTPAPATALASSTAPAAEAPVQAARNAPTTPVAPASDTQLVMQIQRGLASLGFFRAPVDGKPGPETARAIREFESFNNFKMTGQVKPDLVDLLVKANATI